MSEEDEKSKELKLTMGETALMPATIEIDDAVYGKRYFVYDDECYKEVTKERVEPIQVYNARRYKAQDITSFIKYIERYGDAEKGIIFVDKGGVRMFFDERVREEGVTLPIEKSLELKTFLYSINHATTGQCRSFTQRELAKALELFPECVEDGAALLPVVEHLKIDMQVDFESNIDERDHVFMYKEKTGAQTARIPKRLTLTLPYFEGSPNKVKIEVDLEITKPKSADERPYFTLSDPKYLRTAREALKDEVYHIEALLGSGWLFIWGDCGPH